MAMTDLKIIGRSLRSRQFATVLTCATVGIAVALILVLLVTRDAARSAFERGTGNMHVLVSRDSSRMGSVLNSVFYAGIPQSVVTHAEWTAVSAHPLVDWALLTVQGDNYRGWPTMGVEARFFRVFRPDGVTPFELREGEFIREGTEGVWDAVIGSRAAAGAGLRVGDTFVITHGSDADRGVVHENFTFTVRGVLRPTGTAHDRAIFVTPESKWIVHAEDLRRAEARRAGRSDFAPPAVGNLAPGEMPVTALYVRAKRDATIGQLVGLLRTQFGLTAAFPGNEVTALFRIVGSVDQVLLGLAILVALTSGVSIAVAMYASMEQRRRQVAVLRVLGCSRGRIFGLVMTESALIGLIGALAGSGAGVAGAWGVARVVESRLTVALVPSVDPLYVMMGISGAVLLAAVAGLIPAVLAYRTPVVHNLRPLG